MISQLFGAVMLIYLLVAICFLAAELWASPRLQDVGRTMLWLGLGGQERQIGRAHHGNVAGGHPHHGPDFPAAVLMLPKGVGEAWPGPWIC